jgi:hypothetical protein
METSTLPTLIAIDCLRCCHHATFSRADLAARGLPADASLAAFTKRLTCSRCGSKAVAAVRLVDDEMQALEKSPGIVPKD